MVFSFLCTTWCGEPIVIRTWEKGEGAGWRCRKWGQRGEEMDFVMTCWLWSNSCFYWNWQWERREREGERGGWVVEVVVACWFLFPADDQLHTLYGDQCTCFRKVQVGATLWHQTFILNVSLGSHKVGGPTITLQRGGDSCWGWESSCTCMKSHYPCTLYFCVFSGSMLF